MADRGHDQRAGEMTWQAATAPHLVEPRTSTRRVMWDVIVGTIPPLCAACWFFGLEALRLVTVACITAAVVESLSCWLRRRPITLADGSGAITAVLLALSVPPRLPTYAIVIGTAVAIGVGKMAFGGLGQNVFNPAMVGRAFLMICFPVVMTTWSVPHDVHAVTQATPLATAKFAGQQVDAWSLAIGNVGGCVGETSALAVLLGGAWLIFKRAADWRLTAGMLLGVAGAAAVEQIAVGSEASLGWYRHLLAGSAMLGAFFIVTDPVTSPLSQLARWIYAVFVGVMTVVIRLFSGYPEGVMFAVLLGNAIAPLLDRTLPPLPVGGKARTAEI